MVEDLGGQTRVCHCDLAADADLRACARLAETTGLDGMSVSRADRPGVDTLTGSPAITDVLRVPGPTPERPLRLTRNVQAFFQGNRFLIEPLVAYVASLVPPGPVIDLYAGVGLFGLALSAAGAPDVTLVEGDTVSGADLARNAEPMGDGTRVVRQAVEAFLASTVTAPAATVILDPPRSGLSKAALAGLLALGAPRVVYVSCDASTLARDARLLLADGYDLDGMRVFDLLPNTAHVETVARFSRT
jgi:tRNA/tmRNA/rRNA uracil-C5-methylase (TrmA/RlmC/RlmD family)